MLMLHLRLKEHNADILVTLNVPKKEANTEDYAVVLQYHTKVFEHICSTIEVADLSKLFG